MMTAGIRRRRRGGFTLVEVAVSMGILAVAGLGAIGLMTAMTRANRDARLRGEAAALARETVETIMSVTASASTKEGFELGLTGAGFPIDGSVLSSSHGTPIGTLRRRVSIDATGAGTHIPVAIETSWGRSGVQTTLRFNIQLERPE